MRTTSFIPHRHHQSTSRPAWAYFLHSVMLSKTLLPLIVLAASVTAAVPPTKRATCSGGQTTANEAVSVIQDFTAQFI